jgi:hypothetical protein
MFLQNYGIQPQDHNLHIHQLKHQIIVNSCEIRGFHGDEDDDVIVLRPIKNDLVLKIPGALPASVRRCTLDKLEVWLRWGPKNTTNTSISTSPRSLQWQNTPLTWAIISSYRMPVLWSRSWDAWTNHQGSNRNRAPSQQHEQGGWLLPE